jgi:hypothetical protein
MSESSVSIHTDTVYTLSIVDCGQEYVWCSYESNEDAVSARDEMQSKETMGRRFYVTKTRLVRANTP